MSISEPGIPVAEIVSALSFALDLTEDAVPGHALRSCLLGMRLAQALGLSEEDRSSLFYALLLKDIGCSSNAARLCQLMGSDERTVKGAVKFEDWTHPTLSGMRMAWSYLWPNAGPFTRLTRLVGLGLHQQSNNQEIISLRCERGASIVRSIGLSPLTATAIRHLDEHWNGSGFPDRLKGHQIPLLSRILLVAQHLDVFGAGRSAEAALSSLEARSGRWFDPELVRLAHMLHHQGTLWTGLSGRNVRAAVLDLEPGQKLVASSEQVDQICGAFADVVDVKSTFTGQHSRRVTDAALMMADALGYPQERRTFIARAALLHDLGKLRVPNSILDKTGRLTADEWTVVREHPVLTTQILGRVELFSELATVAGQHHEKLDGTGYPYGLTGVDLSRESRLIAVADVYSALAEDRPYRPGLALPEIRAFMDKDAGTRLDGTCYEALIACLHGFEPESQAVA
jgi:putative nucleotidyltransferase with HDIG domain